MKDEFLNFTGTSWGEFSNASGRRGSGNNPTYTVVDLILMEYGCYVFTELAPEDVYEIVQNVFYANPALAGEFQFPEVPLSESLVAEISIIGSDVCIESTAPPQVNPCQAYLDAFNYLQSQQSQITVDNAEWFFGSIAILLGENIYTEQEEIIMEPYGDVPSDAQYDTYDEPVSPVGYYEPQVNCNSFMDYNCWMNTSEGYSYPYYDPEVVANTLANSMLSLNDFIFSIANGEISLPEVDVNAGYDPAEVLEVIEQLLMRIIELETQCSGVHNVPVIVEQAAGQMAEEFLTWLYNNNYFEASLEWSLEEVICMGEYYHNDSFFFIWEILNYTPTMCGGSGGDCPDCPECPDCGLSENCPDCDCPDPCPQGGGVTGGGGLVVNQGATQAQDGITKPPKPQKPQKPTKPKKSRKPTPKSRTPRVRNRGKSSFNGLRL